MGQQISQTDDSIASMAILSQRTKLKYADARKSVQRVESIPWISRFCCSENSTGKVFFFLRLNNIYLRNHYGKKKLSSNFLQ